MVVEDFCASDFNCPCLLDFFSGKVLLLALLEFKVGDLHLLQGVYPWETHLGG